MHNYYLLKKVFLYLGRFPLELKLLVEFLELYFLILLIVSQWLNSFLGLSLSHEGVVVNNSSFPSCNQVSCLYNIDTSPRSTIRGRHSCCYFNSYEKKPNFFIFVLLTGQSIVWCLLSYSFDGRISINLFLVLVEKSLQGTVISLFPSCTTWRLRYIM